MPAKGQSETGKKTSKKNSAPKTIKKKSASSPQINKNSFCVVGIGASAGGIEAFSDFLKALPNKVGMAFIYVMHLSPERESKLTEIFARLTNMPVTQISKDTEVKPDNIYIIPPGKYLIIKNNVLRLTRREKTDGTYMPIDILFQSLAEDLKNKAIGILLSGTGSDGTIGQRYIKSEGGLTFAQDEKSAKFPDMPGSSIRAGNVDISLTPANIAKELIRIGKHPYIALTHSHEIAEEGKAEEKDGLASIFSRLRMITGVDFSNYKSTTVSRRISRRMAIHRIKEFDNYVALILKDKNEVNELYHDLLINVTNFFRDPEVYEHLEQNIYPKITKDASGENPLRIWVPGCSTGEEVYSLAISLLEFINKNFAHNNIQIFATDISEPSLEKARAGIYSELSVKNLPKKILNNYFMKLNGDYQINKLVRELCVFARHDLTKDPPFSRIDLISCRNLLIYLSTNLQKKIMPVFHYALKPNRFLLLGTSETIGSAADLFHLIDKKFKIYERKQSGSKINNYFDLPTMQTSQMPAAHKEKPEEKKTKDFPLNNFDILKEADKVILNKYAPSGILINNNMEIIQFRGDVNKFISPSAGNASLNIFKMIKEGLSLDLHSAIMKAKKSKDIVTMENVVVESDGTSLNINLEVIPVDGKTLEKNSYFIVLFNQQMETGIPEKKRSAVKPNSKDQQIKRLQEELLVTKDHLQSIIQEMEAANEELISTMEELQSSNEEFQSINEETETIREELQSTNEELITVNDELESRNEELHEINNDLTNLLASVNIPIVMLGSDLTLRRFTPVAKKIWNLIPSDIGRPISNIKSNIEISNLKEVVEKVIDSLEIKEIEVQDNEGKWYSVKIRPYKTTDSKVDGVVISFIDIDTLKQDMNKETKSKEFLRVIIDTVREPLLIIDNELTVNFASKSFYKFFRVNKEETENKFIYDLGEGEWNIPALKILLEKILKENNTFEDYEVVHDFPIIGKKKLSLNARKINASENKEFILLAIEEA